MAFESRKRGGARGGADQFKWDNLDGDKTASEYYLGYGQARNKRWWTQGRPDEDRTSNNEAERLRAERARIKEQEEQLMMEALGIKPKQKRSTGKQLSKVELEEALARKHDSEADKGLGSVNHDRVSGLGATVADEPKTRTLEFGGRDGVDVLPGMRAGGPPVTTGTAAAGANGHSGGGSSRMTDRRGGTSGSKDRARERESGTSRRRHKRRRHHDNDGGGDDDDDDEPGVRNKEGDDGKEGSRHRHRHRHSSKSTHRSHGGGEGEGEREGEGSSHRRRHRHKKRRSSGHRRHHSSGSASNDSNSG